MALKDIAPVLTKDFNFLMLDSDRYDDADKVLKRYDKTTNTIPWFMFLNGNGEAIATSTHPESGNIGYPGEGEAGASYFGEMLKKAAKRITDDEIAMMVKSVLAFRDAKLPEK